MKSNSLRKVQDSLLNVSLNASPEALEHEKSLQKVRGSVAMLGLALSVGTAGVLFNQQDRQVSQVGESFHSNQALVEPTQKLESVAQIFTSSADLTFLPVSTHAYPAATPANIGYASSSNPKLADVKANDVSPKIALGNIGDSNNLVQKTNALSLVTDARVGTGKSTKNLSSDLVENRRLVAEIMHKLKSGETIDAVAEHYRQPLPTLESSQAELLAVNYLSDSAAENSDQNWAESSDRPSLNPENTENIGGQFVPVSHRNRSYRQDRLARQIEKLPKYSTYKVATGDTVEKIAQKSGVSQRDIAKLNRIKNPNLLFSGQELKLPATKVISVLNSSNRKPAKQIASSLKRSTGFAAQSPTVNVVPVASTLNSGAWQGLVPERLDSMMALEPAAQGASALFDQPTEKRLEQKAQAQKAQEQKNSVATLPSPATVIFPSVANPLASANIAAVQPGLAISSLTTGRSHPNGKKEVDLEGASLPNLVPTTKVAKVIPASISPRAIEQTDINLSSNAKPAMVEPAAEPAVKLARIAPIPTLPMEQERANTNLPADLRGQAATEPTEQIATLPEASETQRFSGNSSESAFLPQPTSRLSSLEIKRSPKLEPQTLFRSVAQPTRVAAANITASPLLKLDRGNNVVRQAKADTSAVSPQLPALVATAYLPESTSSSNFGLSTGFIWPAQGQLSSGFGWRWGRPHQGIDIAAPVGTPIVAAAAGVVESAGWNSGGYGYLVEIRHNDGTVTRYAHNSALYVRAGQAVNQGQTISAMGSTGFSTGPHLHFEVRPNGRGAINPMIVLASRNRG